MHGLRRAFILTFSARYTEGERGRVQRESVKSYKKYLN